MSEIPLLIESLSFHYRDRPGAAIHNISIEAKAGEVLIIAEASGCGKTTLVRCINGLIPRSCKGEIIGHILVQGEDPGVCRFTRPRKKSEQYYRIPSARFWEQKS